MARLSPLVPVRVLLAVNDPGREHQLMRALADEGLQLAGRCLDAATLLEQARGHAEVALVTATLHRLTAATLLALREAGLPLILLADTDLAQRYQDLAVVLPLETPPADVCAALIAAAGHGGAGGRRPPRPTRGAAGVDGPAGSAATAPAGRGRVTALVSGRGAPGVTMLASALAAELAERAPGVLLVDADLRGGAVATQLALDPRQGLFSFAYGPHDGPETWARRLDDELQDGPGFMVLTGIERASQRAQVREDVIAAALATARGSFAEVVVDAGALLDDRPGPAAEGVLRRADRVLLVAVPTLLGLWYARAARDLLVETLAIPPERLAVVLNRRRGAACHAAADVARAFGAPVLADVPDDPRAADWALAEQLPLTQQARPGRAARAVRLLAAELLREPHLGPPTPATATPHTGWRWPRPRRLIGRRRRP